jgi:hypothetical protein
LSYLSFTAAAVLLGEVVPRAASLAKRK